MPEVTDRCHAPARRPASQRLAESVVVSHEACRTSVRHRVCRASDTVIKPVGARPDLIRIRDRIYVAYNKGQTIQTSDTALLVLSTEPTVLGDVDLPDPTIADAPGAAALYPMDIRLAWDEECTLWTTLECIDPDLAAGTSVTYLFVAAYDVCIDPDSPTLLQRSAPLAMGQGGRIDSLTEGASLLDDPAPLVSAGKLHVLTRYHLQPRYRVHRLTSTLALDAAWDVDVDAVLSGIATQCSLATVSGRALLFQGDSAGGPCPAGVNDSNLGALELAGSLGTAESMTPLSSCSAFETYAVGARLGEDGRLYVGYQLASCATTPTFAPRLKVFDPASWTILDSVALTSPGVAGERVTVDVAGGRVFVSYTTTMDWAIRLKTLEWQRAPSGWSPVACP
jgi:hypothetical protein